MGEKNPFYGDITSLSSEVTGSCHLLTVKRTRTHKSTQKLLIDCGLFQEERYNELNQSFPFNPDEIDACLVTHNHVDHTGRLPLLVKKGFKGKIYTTNATATFLPLALYDSEKVLRDTSKKQHRKTLYDETDVRRTLEKVVPCDFNKSIQLMDGVKATFFNNGHLIGAACILLELSCEGCENINILFTGDYNNKNVFFDVDPIPERVKKLPITVVQESTYGYMDSSQIISCFKQNILKCIQSRGISVVLMFSLGQKILYEIRKMQETGELDEKIPVFLDGNLAIRYTDLHLKAELGIKEEMKDFLPRNLTFVNKENRSQVLNSKNCKIILTTSGMGSHGPAQTYIPALISKENVLIHFTGYTAEGTLGYRLKNAEKEDVVEVGGIMVKKKAKIEYTTEFSSHAKADEMIDFLNEFQNLRFVLVNHGESKVKEDFAKRIVNEVDPRMVGILNRKYTYRINPYGFVKTIPTKFE